MKTFKTIDAYIKTYPKGVQAILKKLRLTIRKAAPKATEAISYGIPTFKLGGKNLVHFGGFKDHVSFFPAQGGIESALKEAASYKKGKGTLQFPLDEPLPYALVTKITKFRMKEVRKAG